MLALAVGLGMLIAPRAEAVVLIDLSLDCDETTLTCNAFGQEIVSNVNDVDGVQGVFEQMQHIETLDDALLDFLLVVTADQPFETRFQGPLFYSDERGEPVGSPVLWDLPPVTSRSYNAGAEFRLDPGLFVHGVFFPFMASCDGCSFNIRVGTGPAVSNGNLTTGVRGGVWGEEIPEPSTLLLLGAGFLGVAMARRSTAGA